MNTLHPLILRKRPIGIVLLLFLFAGHLSAQTLIRHLHSPEVATQMRQIDSLKAKKYTIEKSLATTTTTDDAAELTIPIIFHIVHHQPSEEVSKTQINNQITALNTAFSGQGGNSFTHLSESREGYGMFKADDAAIRFCLANRPDAINYVSSSVAKWGADFGLLTEPSGVSLIAPDQYLNVVVAPLADSVSGYSALPWFPADLDAVIIDYRYFGTLASSYPFDEGKSLVHLISNTLMVKSLWTNGKCEDDGLIDTPIHNVPNRGCPAYVHVSTCFDNPVELTYNYLDNSDDRCLSSFTKSQVERMRKVLQVVRKGWIGNAAASICGEASALLSEEAATSRDHSLTDDLTNDLPELLIRPNPANNFVEISLKERRNASFEPIDIRLFSASGQLLYDYQLVENTTLSIDSSQWPSGLYFVKSRIGATVTTQTLAIINGQ
ncbi:MAG: zinc-dependent metalloprotease [Bacteroidota bacterium]